MKPRLSFIIPVYNGEKTIGKTLRSLTKEVHNSNAEIIIVDNNSNDKTPLIIKKLGLVAHHLKKRSRSRARNYGASLAKGEYLIFIDDSIILKKGWVSRLNIKILDGTKQIIQGSVVPLFPQDDKNKTLPRYITAFFGIRSGGSFNTAFARGPERIALDTATVIIKKELFIKLGGFNEKYQRFEDRELGKRIQAEGYIIDPEIDLISYKLIFTPSAIGFLKVELTDFYYEYLWKVENRGLAEPFWYFFKKLVSQFFYSRGLDKKLYFTNIVLSISKLICLFPYSLIASFHHRIKILQ